MFSSAPLQNVAVVGATGNVGSTFAKALVQHGKHAVTGIVRNGSKGKLPDGAKRVEADYDDEQSLITALFGQQFLIITLSTNAPDDLHNKIVQAAAKAGVRYIMPNSFSNDIRDEALVREDLYSAGSVAKCNEIEAAGSSYVAMVCGFWYQWSLALPLGTSTFGIDIAKKHAIIFDDGTTPIPTSTFKLCGEALAKLLSLPESGSEPALENWRNKPLYIASFCVSQRDMLDSLHRVIGDSDSDWKIEYENSKERYGKGIVDLQKGDKSGFMRAMYTRPFFPIAGGHYQDTRGLQNELLGLSKEDLDEATMEAVEMVKAGWNPFA